MFIKSIILILFVLISNVFCAEDKLILISDQYPLLFKFEKFVEEFNSENISKKIITLINFYRETRFLGRYDYRRSKSLEILSLAYSLIENKINIEDRAKLIDLITKIYEIFPDISDFKIKIDDNYF